MEALTCNSSDVSVLGWKDTAETGRSFYTPLSDAQLGLEVIIVSAVLASEGSNTTKGCADL